MKDNLVVILVGDDRPGLVETLSNTIAEHGGNWEESRMAHLAGKFAGILSVTVARDRVGALTDALSALRARGLRVLVEDSAGQLPAPPQHVRVDVVGNDREGIVRDLARALARHHINVEELSTHCEDAPMGGGRLFTARAWLGLPAGTGLDELRRLLEGLGDDLMVDLAESEPAARP